MIYPDILLEALTKSNNILAPSITSQVPVRYLHENSVATPGCLSHFNGTFFDEIYILLNNYVMVTSVCLIFFRNRKKCGENCDK